MSRHISCTVILRLCPISEVLLIVFLSATILIQSARANREGLVPGPPAVGPTRGYSREIFYGAPLPTYTSSKMFFYPF